MYTDEQHLRLLLPHPPFKMPHGFCLCSSCSSHCSAQQLLRSLVRQEHVSDHSHLLPCPSLCFAQDLPSPPLLCPSDLCTHQTQCVGCLSCAHHSNSLPGPSHILHVGKTTKCPSCRVWMQPHASFCGNLWCSALL